MPEKKVTFEGDEIEAFSVTVRQHKGEIAGPLLLEEFVHLKVVVRVDDVNHRVNQRTGVLERQHILKIIDLEVVK
jgi:hypothetical protein